MITIIAIILFLILLAVSETARFLFAWTLYAVFWLGCLAAAGAIAFGGYMVLTGG